MHKTKRNNNTKLVITKQANKHVDNYNIHYINICDIKYIIQKQFTRQENNPFTETLKRIKTFPNINQ